MAFGKEESIKGFMNCIKMQKLQDVPIFIRQQRQRKTTSEMETTIKKDVRGLGIRS